jgi:superoxide reductase
MAKQLQTYKCEKCGNIVMVLQGGPGELVCCGEPMELLEEQTAEMANEKHVPVIEKDDTGYTVTVGTTLHPMEDKHYIQWIELITKDRVLRKWLKPGDEPKAHFCFCGSEPVWAREHCNIHKLWKNENK